MKKQLKKFGLILSAAAIIAGGSWFGTEALIEKATDAPLEGNGSTVVAVAKVGGTQTEIGTADMNSNERILATLNKMTHQKVVAADKWGAVEMTPENIDVMKKAVEKANTLQDQDVVLDMLERWQRGDFGSIVSDHNTILELQNGTIGRATDRMTAEQEQKFIQMNF